MAGAMPLGAESAGAASSRFAHARRSSRATAARLPPRPLDAGHLRGGVPGRSQQFLSAAANAHRARRRTRSDSPGALRERLARVGGTLPGTVPRRRRATADHLRLVRRAPLGGEPELFALG